MPQLKKYRLFISHAWRHHEDYDRIVKMLDSAPNFDWANYSVPRHDPLLDPNDPGDEEKLTDELKQQISPVHCVLVLSGIYVSYSDWIQKEIDIALNYGKPIIGIKPWGQEKVPKAVSDAALIIVGWQTDSIVEAIRKYSL